jgi:hypothetical protein
VIRVAVFQTASSRAPSIRGGVSVRAAVAVVPPGRVGDASVVRLPLKASVPVVFGVPRSF